MSSGLSLIADINEFSHVPDGQQNVKARFNRHDCEKRYKDKKVIRSRTPSSKKGASIEISPRAKLGFVAVVASELGPFISQ
jgi:hypothetical protein